MKGAGEKDLLAFLKDIDSLLTKEKLTSKAVLYIFGGAAAVIAYKSKRGTRDIDALIKDRRLAARLIEWAGEGSALAKKHDGLHLQPVNTTLMLIEEPDYEKRCAEVFKGELKNIQAHALGKEDLILSKLSRYNDRDRADIEFLIKGYKIEPEKLISLYKSARACFIGDLSTLDSVFNLVLNENYNLPPQSFSSAQPSQTPREINLPYPRPEGHVEHGPGTALCGAPKGLWFRPSGAISSGSHQISYSN